MTSLGPIWLTVALACATTLSLLVLGTPLAWWLATTRSRFRPAVEALTALPLVLPPTVLGFYMLVLLGPASAVGGFWVTLTGEKGEGRSSRQETCRTTAERNLSAASG